MALPPCIRIRAPAIAANGCTAETMPCCAITSERVCGTHPSERSPRTAAQDGADGDSLHIWTGGESASADQEFSSVHAHKMCTLAPNTLRMMPSPGHSDQWLRSGRFLRVGLR